MNIVLLTSRYYPEMGPSAACIEKYVRLLQDKHKITIICQKGASGVNVHNDGNMSILCVSNWLNDLRLIIKSNLKKGNSVRLNTLLLQLIRTIGALKEPFVYPTRNSWLIEKYYKKLQRLEKQGHVDAIISVSNPICTHLAALRFKKEHPTTRWISYSTDPFTFYDAIYTYIPFKGRRKRKNFLTEKSIYETADNSIFTEELYTMALNDFHASQDKAICFPYVFSDFSSIFKERKPSQEKPKMIYAGALNKVIRNPEYALNIITQVNDIECVLYQAGDCNVILQKFDGKNITVKSLEKRNRYLEIICNEADILLNIGNNSKLQAPSKMLELLSTGLPVVNFYYYKNKQYEMIEKYPLGINIGRDDSDALERLRDFVKKENGMRMAIPEIKAMFPKNTIEEQFDTLNKLISNNYE